MQNKATTSHSNPKPKPKHRRRWIPIFFPRESKIFEQLKALERNSPVPDFFFWGENLFDVFVFNFSELFYWQMFSA